MKKFIKYIFASAMLMSVTGMTAQNCDIPMSVIIDEGFSQVTAEASSVLDTQLKRLAEQSGLDVGWDNANFAITAKFDQMDRYIVGSAPTQVVNVYGVTLYVADIYHQKLFSSTYLDLKGVGTNDTKSTINAIRQLNLNNKNVSTFLSNAKQKVIYYYDSQLPTIIKDARTKASMKKYAEALAMLAVIPTCCNGYDRAMKEALRVYYLYRDEYALSQLNKARALWAANPTQEGSEEVVEILSSIDPDAKCYSQAMNLLSQVGKTVKTDVDYETKKKYQDTVDLEKLRINAIAEIGKGYAANRPTNILFLGHGSAVSTNSPIDISGK